MCKKTTGRFWNAVKKILKQQTKFLEKVVKQQFEKKEEQKELRLVEKTVKNYRIQKICKKRRNKNNQDSERKKERKVMTGKKKILNRTRFFINLQKMILQEFKKGHIKKKKRTKNYY